MKMERSVPTPCNDRLLDVTSGDRKPDGIQTCKGGTFGWLREAQYIVRGDIWVRSRRPGRPRHHCFCTVLPGEEASRPDGFGAMSQASLLEEPTVRLLWLSVSL